MQPMNNESAQAERHYRTTLIIFFAIFSTIGLMLFLSLAVLERPHESTENRFISFLLGGVAGFNVVLSFVLKQKILSQAVAKRRMDLVQTAYILALSLCESCALFGLILYLLTPNAATYIIFALAAIGMLLHIPRREHFLAASPSKSL